MYSGPRAAPPDLLDQEVINLAVVTGTSKQSPWISLKSASDLKNELVMAPHLAPVSLS